MRLGAVWVEMTVAMIFENMVHGSVCKRKRRRGEYLVHWAYGGKNVVIDELANV